MGRFFVWLIAAFFTITTTLACTPTPNSAASETMLSVPSNNDGGDGGKTMTGHQNKKKIYLLDDMPFLLKDSITSFDMDHCGTTKYDYEEIDANKTKFARPNEFPWLVRLEIGRNRRRYAQICEGVIVSRNVILTIRKCFAKLKSTSDITVKLGDHEPNRMEQGELLRGVSEIAYHNESSTDPDDYALAILNEPITFSNKIRPICLPSSCSETCNKPADNLTAGGWFANTLVMLKGSTALTAPTLDVVNNGTATCGSGNWTFEIAAGVEINATRCGLTTVAQPDDFVMMAPSSSLPSMCRNYIGMPVMCKNGKNRRQLFGLAMNSVPCGDVSAYRDVCGDVINWIYYIVSITSSLYSGGFYDVANIAVKK